MSVIFALTSKDCSISTQTLSNLLTTQTTQEGSEDNMKKQEEVRGKKRYFTRSTGAAPPFAKRICKGHQLY